MRLPDKPGDFAQGLERRKSRAQLNNPGPHRRQRHRVRRGQCRPHLSNPQITATAPTTNPTNPMKLKIPLIRMKYEFLRLNIRERFKATPFSRHFWMRRRGERLREDNGISLIYREDE